MMYKPVQSTETRFAYFFELLCTSTFLKTIPMTWLHPDINVFHNSHPVHEANKKFILKEDQLTDNKT